MLTANLWTKGGLVNGSIRTVHDILFKNQGPPSLPAAVFVKFDAYEGPTITSTEGNLVVLIVPIKRSWEGKSGMICSRQQVPFCLAWAITVHKSQGLTLSKVKIDIGSKEFAVGLTFIVTLHIRSLSDIYFRQFTFDRLQRIKNSSRLQERKAEEERLTSRIARQRTSWGIFLFLLFQKDAGCIIYQDARLIIYFLLFQIKRRYNEKKIKVVSSL